MVAMVVAAPIEDGKTLSADEAESAGTLVSVTVSARSTGRACVRSPRAISSTLRAQRDLRER
jgi:hypothetical protein